MNLSLPIYIKRENCPEDVGYNQGESLWEILLTLLKLIAYIVFGKVEVVF